MQQNDAAIVPLLFDSPQDDVGTRFRPILWIDILQDHEVVQVFRDFQRSELAKLRRTCISCVRRPEQGGRATCDCFEQ